MHVYPLHINHVEIPYSHISPGRKICQLEYFLVNITLSYNSFLFWNFEVKGFILNKKTRALAMNMMNKLLKGSKQFCYEGLRLKTALLIYTRV